MELPDIVRLTDVVYTYQHKEDYIEPWYKDVVKDVSGLYCPPPVRLFLSPFPSSVVFVRVVGKYADSSTDTCQGTRYRKAGNTHMGSKTIV